MLENDRKSVVIFTISRRIYYVFQRKRALRREEIVVASHAPILRYRSVWGYRKVASPRPEPEQESCSEECKITLRVYVSKRQSLCNPT